MEAPELKATKRTFSRSTTSVEPAHTTNVRRKGSRKTTSPGKPAGRVIKRGASATASQKIASAGPKPSSSNGTGDRTNPTAQAAPAVPEAGHLGDVYDPECPSQKALETIATKWAILVLHTLIVEPMRFNKLQLTLPGISQKVLTQQLRKLENTGLIHRHVRPTSPPSVVYEVTPAGHELRAALSGLCDWANKHAVALGIAPKTKISSRC